ncbi:hypothetical protein N7481_005077 [Penicillium waksmanii]|uniref:uncharacterized protein n=1 Tax=Penicillium waksmanii TaxID=69791 RepID=UPI00254815A9|nr:uncharacterized protein N7481_005077 [Penicillium waksmanii]KAJ5982978.1 hypothetical protein N7481_005077 [Penicillium waksmanii]
MASSSYNKYLDEEWRIPLTRGSSPNDESSGQQREECWQPSQLPSQKSGTTSLVDLDKKTIVRTDPEELKES